MDLANDTITCFYQDMGILNKIYGYDFHEIVNMKSENYYAEKTEKGVSIVMIFMGACRGSGIFNCCASLESLSKIIFNNFIGSTLFGFIFIVLVQK